MALIVKRALLTWVQAVSLPSLVGNLGVRPGPPFGTPGGHTAAITAAGSSAHAWFRSWDAYRAYNRFWYRHLGKREKYWAIDPAKCWPRLVPLWSNTDVDWLGTATTIDVLAERLLFPCAAGVILSLDVTGPLSLDALVKVAAEARTGKVYQRAQGNPESLRPLLSGLLDETQQSVLGATDPDATGDNEPLFAATIVAADGVSKPPPLVDGNPLHKRLHALAHADSTTGPPPALTTTSAPVSTSKSGGGILLVDGRSRVVWSPQKMLDATKTQQLACYHHNLALASVFAEALIAYTGYAADGGRPHETVKHAVNLLGMFYGRAPDIWSSSAIQRQIDASGRVPDINRLRKSLGWGPLSPRTPAT
jgi:hypothetical protein